MRAFLAVSLLAVAAADQATSASTGYGAPAPGGYGGPAPAPAHGYQAGAARSQGGAHGGPHGGAPAGVHGGAHGGARGGYNVSPGGFKTPVGTGGGYQPEYQYEPSPYSFDYAVNNYDSGAQYSANENSDGKQTTGFYSVQLPDGRLQTVKYTVDDYGGFNAQVSYEGEASYPEPSQYAGPGGHAGGYSAGPSTGGYSAGPSTGGYSAGPSTGGYSAGPSTGGYSAGPSAGYKSVVKTPSSYKPGPVYSHRPAPVFKSNATPAAGYAAVVPAKKYAAE